MFVKQLRDLVNRENFVNVKIIFALSSRENRLQLKNKRDLRKKLAELKKRHARLRRKRDWLISMLSRSSKSLNRPDFKSNKMSSRGLNNSSISSRKKLRDKINNSIFNRQLLSLLPSRCKLQSNNR